MEERSRGRKYPRCGAVTRAVAATRTMTIPFYFFLSSPVAQALSIPFISPLPPPLFLRPRAADSSPSSSPPSLLTEVYLNIFRDRTIHSYCSAFFIGFRFPKGRTTSSLFIHRDGRHPSRSEKNMAFVLVFPFFFF